MTKRGEAAKVDAADLRPRLTILMNRAVKHLVILSSFFLLVTSAQARIADGVYSSICVSPETLDQGGFELRLTSDGNASIIAFWICEGGCQSYPTREIILQGSSVSFVAEGFSENYKFDGVLKGSTLTLGNAKWGRERLMRQRGQTSIKQSETKVPIPVKRCS